MTSRSTLLTPRDRRLHWRTWNLLVQIMEATDDQDRCRPSLDTRIRALADRKWIETCECGEWIDGRGYIREVPRWTITTKGRAALGYAIAEGVQVG